MWYSKESIKLIPFKNRNDKLMSIHVRILEFIGIEENIGLVGFLLENLVNKYMVRIIRQRNRVIGENYQRFWQ
jgi:hypothetical protein